MDAGTAMETITAELRDRPEVRALFLSGSFGTGLADEFSDIDFLMVTTDGATDEIAEVWRRAVSRLGEIVLWWDRQVAPALINAITVEWVRTDVVILKPDQMHRHTKDSLKVLFDRAGIYDGLAETSGPEPLDRRRQKYQFKEFIRILGLLPLAMGREEYLNGVLGVFHLRNLLVDLMIKETGVPHRGGALHLNRLITDEQKAVLAALPVPEPTRAGIVGAHLAYAEAYIPRARRLAEAWGVAWPQAFEEATWARLDTSSAIERPKSLT